MAYQDFTVTFEPIADSERYRVVTHSPTNGQAVANFVSPFGEERINTWQHGLDPDEMHMIGTLLYRRLFSNEICEAFQSAQRVAERQGLALRIKLAVPPELAQLPWEYLYDPDANQFLCLDGGLALVRHIPAVRVRKLARFAPETGIFLYDEMRGTTRQLGSFVSAASAAIRTQMLAAADFQSDAPQAFPLHVLHLYSTYGRDPASGELALRLADGGSDRWLTARKMARWLGVNPSVQLVVVDRTPGADANPRDASAFAAELVTRRFVPAALAFRFPLPPMLRDAFFKTFYRALAQDTGLDLAVTEGRRTIAAMDGDWEWGAPVLYSALSDDQPRPSPERFETETTTVLPAPQPERATVNTVKPQLPT